MYIYYGYYDSVSKLVTKYNEICTNVVMSCSHPVFHARHPLKCQVCCFQWNYSTVHIMWKVIQF